MKTTTLTIYGDGTKNINKYTCDVTHDDYLPDNGFYRAYFGTFVKYEMYDSEVRE